jgi:hypothetical protein
MNFLKRFLEFGFASDTAIRQAGREAMYTSYDNHYRWALSNGLGKPIFHALYGAMCSRYKVCGTFIAEHIHTVELAPFMMMDQVLGKTCIADYALAPEIPDQTDLAELKIKINTALRDRSGEYAEEYYDLIIAALPVLKETRSGIRWFGWLDADVAQRMIADANVTA